MFRTLLRYAPVLIPIARKIFRSVQAKKNPRR
jgi:hypothetical protein